MSASSDWAVARSQYALGLVFIFACAAIWAGASVLIQYIYEDLDFKSPFFLTYLATSLLSAHLLAHYVSEWVNTKFGRGQVDGAERDEDERESRLLHCSLAGDDETKTIALAMVDDGTAATPAPAPSAWEIIKVAAVIAPVWFAANCLYNYSLLMTSVSSSTIISNLSASFTLLFSWYLGLEDITAGKLLGVLVCFAGAVAVGLQDEDGDQQHTLWGDVVALLASAGYGVYTTIIRYKVPDDQAMSMQLLLGYVGAVNALMLLPVLVILVVGRWGNIGDITGEAFGFIALNGFADTVVADYFWARAVVLTSPTVATIGMSITIPIALLTDFCINGIAPTAVSVVGSLSVILGFVLVNLTRERQEEVVAAVASRCRRVYVQWCLGYRGADPDADPDSGRCCRVRELGGSEL